MGGVFWFARRLPISADTLSHPIDGRMGKDPWAKSQNKMKKRKAASRVLYVRHIAALARELSNTQAQCRPAGKASSICWNDRA